MEELRFNTPEDVAWRLAHKANMEHTWAAHEADRHFSESDLHRQNHENYSAMAAPMMLAEDSVFSVRGVEKFLSAQSSEHEAKRTVEQREQDFESSLAAFAFLSQVATEEGVIDEAEMKAKSCALDDALSVFDGSWIHKREIFELRIGLGQPGGTVSWKNITERHLFVYGRPASIGSAKRAYNEIFGYLVRNEDLVNQFIGDNPNYGDK